MLRVSCVFIAPLALIGALVGAALPAAGQEYYIGSNNNAADPNYALLLTNTAGSPRLAFRYHTTTGVQTASRSAEVTCRR